MNGPVGTVRIVVRFLRWRLSLLFIFFFFNDTATTEIYTLSLHDALPIWVCLHCSAIRRWMASLTRKSASRDRKSTRLNSSHGYISYAVFCLKKKKKTRHNRHAPPTVIGRAPLQLQCTPEMCTPHRCSAFR